MPTRVRFADKAQSLFEPDEHGVPVWVLPTTCVDPARPEEIEAKNPLHVVGKGPVIDFVASLSPRLPQPIRLPHWPAVTLGGVEPQYMQPDPVLVFNDVTDWLKSGCNGIVLLSNDPHQCGRILGRIKSPIGAPDPALVRQ